MLVVDESGREPFLVIANQERPILRNHSFHAVYPGLIGVDKVADHFQRAPLARYRPAHELLLAHAGHRLA